MIIKNIKVYTEDKTFADGKIIIRDGVFEEIIIGQTTASDLELQDTEIVDGNAGKTCGDLFRQGLLHFQNL